MNRKELYLEIINILDHTIGYFFFQCYRYITFYGWAMPIYALHPRGIYLFALMPQSIGKTCFYFLTLQHSNIFTGVLNTYYPVNYYV